MADDLTVRSHHKVPSVALVPYVLISFGITWSIAGLYVFRSSQAAAWFGEITGSHPLYVVATWAPALAGFAVVAFFGGREALKAFLTRITLWRCSLPWGAFLLFGVPLIFAVGAWAKGTLTAPFPFGDIRSALAVMGFMLFLGPVEEFGWRGVAQPLLQRHVAPVWAGALIGAVWGLWHLPAFYLAGTAFTDWSFLPFLVGNVSLAIIMTPLFNDSHGSILLPALFHYQLINPLWPDAQPYDSWYFAVAAIIVVWLNRKTMFKSAGAVTEVIPGSENPPNAGTGLSSLMAPRSSEFHRR